MEEFRKEYRQLLLAADAWFASCMAVGGAQIRCSGGCAGCCHGLFDITLLDALVLQEGFGAMADADRSLVLAAARNQLARLQKKWPAFKAPYLLNGIPQEEWDSPEENATPCPLLDAHGRCRLYADRPLICRLHGLPHVDFSGEVFDDSWCTRNFPDSDPLAVKELSGDFRRLFRREAQLLHELAERLGIAGGELDTYIATALLIKR